MSTILVLGGSGFVGSYILSRMVKIAHDLDLTIIASSTHEPTTFDFHHDMINWYHLRLTDSYDDQLSVLFDVVQPDIVVNTIVAGLSTCRDTPDLADLLNHRINHTIVRLLQQKHPTAKYYLVSTSYVFDSIPDSPDESTTPDCRSVYGTTKYAGEQAVTELGDRVSIIRVTTVWGKKLLDFQHSNLLLDVINPDKNTQMTIFDNIYRTPTAAPQVATAIVDYIFSGDHLSVLHITHNKIKSFASWIRYLPDHLTRSLSSSSYTGTAIPHRSGLTTKYPRYSRHLDQQSFLQTFSTD